jgi:hypothetical protein
MESSIAVNGEQSIAAGAATRPVDNRRRTSSDYLPGAPQRVRQELKFMRWASRYPVLFLVKGASRGDRFHGGKIGSANNGVEKYLG